MIWRREDRKIGIEFIEENFFTRRIGIKFEEKESIIGKEEKDLEERENGKTSCI